MLPVKACMCMQTMIWVFLQLSIILHCHLSPKGTDGAPEGRTPEAACQHP